MWLIGGSLVMREYVQALWQWWLARQKSVASQLIHRSRIPNQLEPTVDNFTVFRDIDYGKAVRVFLPLDSPLYLFEFEVLSPCCG